MKVAFDAHNACLFIACVLFFLGGLFPATKHPMERYSLAYIGFGLALWVATQIPGLIPS